MKQNRKIWLACLVLLLLAVGMGAVYVQYAPAPVAGVKSISVTVVHGDQSVRTVELDTDAKYLQEALEAQKLIAGEPSDYGLLVTTVDGETADTAAQEWWSFSRDGAMLETGVGTTPVTDGAAYEIALQTGYEG